MMNLTGGPRPLSSDELADLRREMAESSAWMRGELNRLRAVRDHPHVTLFNGAALAEPGVLSGHVDEANALSASNKPPGDTGG